MYDIYLLRHRQIIRRYTVPTYNDKKKHTLRNTCLKNLFGSIVSTAAFSADTYFKRAVLQIGRSLVRSQLVSMGFSLT